MEKGWKIITILTVLEFCLKMLTYTKYAPLFAQNSALSKFNSFPTWFVPSKGMIENMTNVSYSIDFILLSVYNRKCDTFVTFIEWRIYGKDCRIKKC